MRKRCFSKDVFPYSYIYVPSLYYILRIFARDLLRIFCNFSVTLDAPPRFPADGPTRSTRSGTARSLIYGLSGVFVGHRQGQQKVDPLVRLERAVRKAPVQLGRRRLEAEGVIAARGSEKSDGSIPNGASIPSEKRFFSTSNAPCPFIALPRSAELRITTTSPRSSAPRSGRLRPHIGVRKTELFMNSLDKNLKIRYNTQY